MKNEMYHQQKLIQKQSLTICIFIIITLSTMLTYELFKTNYIFFVIRLPFYFIELIIPFIMTHISSIDPTTIDYSKYDYFVGPIRKVFGASKRNIKHLEVNAIHTEIPFDRKYNLNFCFKCNSVKHQRVTHCNVCNCCILRFDHHNDILNCCIGLHNYKTYILLLFLICFNVTMDSIYLSTLLIVQFQLLDLSKRMIYSAYLIVCILLSCVYINKIKLISHQIYHNYTAAETDKYEQSKYQRCQYHYDLGSLKLNIQNIFN